MLKRISSLLFCAVLVALPAQAWAQAVDAGYRDFSYAVSGGPTTPTGEKPESKLWFNDGFWWGSLYNNTVKGYRIYRFDVSSQTWTDTGTVLDPRSSSRADTLWDGQHLYVASHIFTTSAVPDTNSANWGRLYRYSYNSQTNTYSLDSGFPVNITRGREESLVLAKDSTGQLWVTYVESQKVMVNRSTGGDLVWGTPFVLPASQTAVSVATDDISGVLAFQGNKIGVMWSNQTRSKTYFAVHLDPDADTAWQTEETALPGPNDTGAFSDDHINLKSLQTDGTGRVFAAIKTSLTASNSPLVMLLVRSTSGNWSNYVFGRVRDHHTRPVVLLDEEHSRLYMFATAPEAGGTIYYKTTPINNIQLATGLGTPFIKSTTDTAINNATSTKQNLSSATGLLVLASDANTQNYLHNYLSLGATTNQAPVVNAGPDQTITLPANATLSGTVTDDGLPNPPNAVTNTWTKVSGPGTVNFVNPGAASTTASFSASGTYVLRLTANDSALSRSDDVTVTVNPSSPANQAPVVSAGTDQTITLPASVTLSGTVTDDGLPNPPGSLTITWTKFSGPGTATFANASAASTTASFSTSGTYVLRLTANDSALSSSDDVTVTVNPAAATNQAPAVNAGADQTITLPANATLSGTVTDDGLPNPPNAVTNTWTQVSGPGTVNFVNPGAASTTASFSASGTYVLRLTADDSALSSTDDVTVNVNPARPPGQSNVTFIEPGTDATQDFKLWSSTTATATGGSISSDSTLAHTGPRSIKLNSGTATSGFVFSSKTGVLANTGSRASSWVYITANATTSTGYGLLAARNPSGGAVVWTVNVDNAGRIRLNTNANVMLKLSTLTVPLNRWFRVSVAQQITSTTSYTIKVWVDGTLYVSADGGTSPALNNIGGTQFGVGFLAGGVSGAGGAVQYHDDLYIDDGADLSDTGDVRVTAKLPGGDTTSTFGTAVGANPSFGSRYTNVNERPLNVANGWTSSGAGQSERYLLQGAAEGDVNLSPFVQLGYTGWIYAKRSVAGTENMVVNGATVPSSVTTSAAIYTQTVSGAGYPSSAAGIGLDASASGVTLYECGVLIAYLFN